MIYLDVTSAAASPVNMGVQRTTRGLFQLLQNTREVIPLRWDFFSKRYSRLSPRERGFLERPFASYRKSSAVPGRWDHGHWYKSTKDFCTRPSRGIGIGNLLAEGNLLLIPDLCWDARIHAWPGWNRWPGRKAAFFHDAMPLRIPGQADSRDELFAAYVRQLGCMDLIICISREVEQDLLCYWKTYGVAAKPVQVLPWPVPFDLERPSNPPNFSARKVIYVARLKLRKNHLVLLEASEELWRRGEDFSLDLIGVEDALIDTRKILRRLQALADQGRSVRWRKHISDAELAEAYRECSFTAFPSRLEGFGLPILESLWHRRPVICGREGAIGEVAEGGGCLQIDQNSVPELAEAMGLLLNDPVVYAARYEESVRRTFRSWSDYGQELDGVLDSGGQR